ncbi:MAG: damage-inducible protein J [Clostridiales bacterium]|nr:damage-inducible protein J [Clostridiales bacterium]
MASTTEMTNFTFKMDKTTRQQYNNLCDKLGLTMSAATLALVKQAIRTQSMSFSLRDENGFLPEEASELRRRAIDVKRDNVICHDLLED